MEILIKIIKDGQILLETEEDLSIQEVLKNTREKNILGRIDIEYHLISSDDKILFSRHVFNEHNKIVSIIYPCNVNIL